MTPGQRNVAEAASEASVNENVIDVDASTLGDVPTSVLKPLDHKREDNALVIAKAIMWLFAGSFVLSFAFLIALSILAYRHPTLILTQIVPALDDFTRFISLVGGIFSPLLAFILGFYFSSERRIRER